MGLESLLGNLWIRTDGHPSACHQDFEVGDVGTTGTVDSRRLESRMFKTRGSNPRAAACLGRFEDSVSKPQYIYIYIYIYIYRGVLAGPEQTSSQPT